LTAALNQLTALGLLAPAPGPDDTLGQSPTGWYVHRWTATTLTGSTDFPRHFSTTDHSPPPDQAAPDRDEGRAQPAAERVQTVLGHQRAAAYWRWRVQVWPQDRFDDLTQLLEARYHHHAAGDLDAAVAITQATASQLRTWGAWTWARNLNEETLSWLTPGTGTYAETVYRLGTLAHDRGDYAAAEAHYRDALDISEKIGNREFTGMGYHQLGMLAYNRGDHPAAEAHYRDALDIFEEIGARAAAGKTNHHLGLLAQVRGDYDAAKGYYRESLAIDEASGDRAGVASSYGQLRAIAELQRDYSAAEVHYHNARDIFEEIGDRLNAGNSYHGLGNLAMNRENYPAAEKYYRDALTIYVEIGYRIGVGKIFRQLARLARARGDYATAEGYFRDALTIFEEMGERIGAAETNSDLGSLTTEQGRPREAVGLQLISLAQRIELGVPGGVVDVYWLGRQRELLGEADFRAALAEHLDEESVQNVLELLELLDQPGMEEGAGRDTGSQAEGDSGGGL
jgi:tetratricopeptide (TPR) repeat protein